MAGVLHSGQRTTLRRRNSLQELAAVMSPRPWEPPSSFEDVAAGSVASIVPAASGRLETPRAERFSADG